MSPLNILTNSASSPGVVPAGSSNPNKVWGTDAGGHPGWRDIPTNTASQSGVVPASSGNPNKVWGTDASGNPSWRDLPGNTASQSGIVSAGSGNTNKVWATDASGNPAWRDINAALTYVNSKLSADVTMTTAGTWYDGPSISLGAGTWLVIAQITMGFNAATAHYSCARITDGTNHYASGQQRPDATAPAVGTITMATIITLSSTTTIKVQGVSATANCLMKAALTNYGSGNNATQITAIKIQ